MPADYATEGATAMPIEDKFFVLLERGLRCTPMWFRSFVYEGFDPTVLILQHTAAIVGAADFELDVWRVRVRFRERFEKLVQDAASRRLSEDIETVLGWYRADGYRVEPEAKKRVASTFLLAAAQDSDLREQMTTLQKLPIGRKAIRLRIGALNDALALYLPDIVRDEVLPATASEPNVIHTGGSIRGNA